MRMDSSTIPYLSDFVASQKFIMGEWFVVPHEGAIYNRFHAEVKGTLLNGYRTIGTSWNGMRVHIMHHRAVWIGANGGRVPEDETLQIDHINGDKQDNRISNLRLVSPRENCHNPHAPSGFYRPGAAHPRAKLTDEQAEEIRRRWKETRTLPKGRGRLTQRRLAAEYGVPQQQISMILQGKAYPPAAEAEKGAA
jgi:hypothetical protein